MAGDARGLDEEAGGVSDADDEPGDRPGLSSAQYAGEARDPFVFVDGDSAGGVKAGGGEAEDELREVVEPAADLLVDELSEGGGDDAAGEDKGGQRVPVHAVPCCGRSRAHAGAGGRYCS